LTTLPRSGRHQGQLFHHFKSKDDLALSAAAFWGEMTEAFFAAAPYHNSKDPLERLLGYVGFRSEILQGDLPDYTCLLGTLVQETYATHPDIRAACDKGMSTHIAILTRDVEAAKPALRARRAMERGKRRLFHPIGFAGRVHLRQGKARLRGRARESRALAVLSRAYLQPAAQHQAKGKGMNDSNAKKFLALCVVPASVKADWAKTDPETKKAAEQKMQAK
jgi:TetR/AcrR family transcriptional regulator, transcriptional repressor for nem operon